MIETRRMVIREATENDIPWIIEMENHPENRDFIWQGTFQEHQEEIKDPTAELLVFDLKEGGRSIGYALIRLNEKSHIFELRRIAIDPKGAGYGREAMIGIIEYAFERKDTNRFWLDVYPDNEIGIRLYESLGMHRDGILRENYKSARGYLDQIIYSILRKEYIAGKKGENLNGSRKEK